MVLFVDIETYSGTDLPDCGVHRYVEDPDFDILLIGYAYGNGPVKVVDLTTEPFPEELRRDLLSPRHLKVAHNAHFERTCLREYLGEEMPPEQWFDTAVLAASCGLPRALGKIGEALKFAEDEAKMKVGKALITEFCKPCKPTKKNGGRVRNLQEHDPVGWATFIEYNRRDVETERTIYKRLIKWRPDYTEQRFWWLDQHINDLGIRVDIQLAQNAIAIDGHYKEDLAAEAVAITGMENPNSTSQVKAWLMEQEGLDVPSLNKKEVAGVVAQLQTDEAKQFMDLRKELSKSSTKKYAAILRAVDSSDHICDTFQFYGAGTGRFTSVRCQLQNMPQNHMPDLDLARELVRSGNEDAVRFFYPVSSTLSELIRTTLIPEPGHKFLVADYSAIEARCTAWVAQEEWRLETFREGGDIYCSSASQMFKVPVEKHGVNSHLRQKGKIAELA